MSKYVRLRGLSYQLVPFDKGGVDMDAAYQTIMNHFAYGSADKPGVYYDEENRRHLNSIRMAHSEKKIQQKISWIILTRAFWSRISLMV